MGGNNGNTAAMIAAGAGLAALTVMTGGAGAALAPEVMGGLAASEGAAGGAGLMGAGAAAEMGAGAAGGGLAGASTGLLADTAGTGAMDMMGTAGAGLMGQAGPGMTGAMDMAGSAGTGMPGSTPPSMLDKAAKFVTSPSGQAMRAGLGLMNQPTQGIPPPGPRPPAFQGVNDPSAVATIAQTFGAPSFGPYASGAGAMAARMKGLDPVQMMLLRQKGLM